MFKTKTMNRAILLGFAFYQFITYGMNGFKIQGALIPEAEIKSGGPPRDGIPSIDKPKFFSADTARKLLPKDSRAIIIRSGEVRKAYPLPILNWHEVVNDNINGHPIVVTYCPLCGTGMVFKNNFSKKPLSFGVSGLLYQSDVLLYDRESESLWSQLLRKAVTGLHKGKSMPLFPSQHLDLFEYLKKYPKTKILSTNTGFNRDYLKSPYGDYSSSSSLYFPVAHLDKTVPIKTWSMLIEYDDQRLIIPISQLEKAKNQQTFAIKDKHIVIDFDTGKNTLACKNISEKIDCISGYYFALKTFYPAAKVYLRKK